MNLYDEIIDYALVSSYDTSVLKQKLLLPFKQDEFYLYYAYCDESNCDFFSDTMCKQIKVSKSEILFLLSDLHTRKRLLNLAQNSISNELLQQESIHDFFEELLCFAIKKRSSDIHFETSNKSFIIRFRIDGALKQFFVLDKRLYVIASSVIKLFCSLDITQKRKPLNGRFSSQISDKKIDFRVSTMPTIKGESIVLRILDEFCEQKELDNLGFNQLQLNLISQSIKSSSGLILITGPTGSGKTTTLYSILQQLNSEDKKIITIEDPIEYQLKNIQQVAVNASLGLTFNEILKHILRQDPDIIMIGEIRDQDSLQIAFQAALTGHLVLSTLHTNDAISTLNRLYDLQAKPYIVANTLKTIISQRLVLKCCSCVEGCEKCNYTNFEGRVSLSEVFNINSELSHLISKKSPLLDILQCAKSSGFKSIAQDAKQKIEENRTTLTEVYKVLGAFDEKI